MAWQMPPEQKTVAVYAMCARLHMREYGTTREQLACIKTRHTRTAQHDPRAMLRKTDTVQHVLSSAMIFAPCTARIVLFWTAAAPSRTAYRWGSIDGILPSTTGSVPFQ